MIDAARLAQFPNIDGFFIIYGNGDITPLIAYLKAYGKDVVAGVIEPDKNSVLCNKVIYLDPNATTQTVLNAGYKKVDTSGYVAPKKTQVAKPAAKPEPVQKAAAAPANDQNTDDAAQMALLLEQFNKIINGTDN